MAPCYLQPPSVGHVPQRRHVQGCGRSPGVPAEPGKSLEEDSLDLQRHLIELSLRLLMEGELLLPSSEGCGCQELPSPRSGGTVATFHFSESGTLSGSIAPLKFQDRFWGEPVLECGQQELIPVLVSRLEPLQECDSRPPCWDAGHRIDGVHYFTMNTAGLKCWPTGER